MSAHDELGDLLLRAGISADQMVALLARVRKEQRAQFREDSIPAWEAAYDSATFTPYLIGYCNDEVSAKAAALAYYRSQIETDDTLDWEPEPLMAVHEWDEWHTLIRTNAEGTVLATDIVVRRRSETVHPEGDPMPAIRAVIEDFDFAGYGIDGVDPTGLDTEWVGDLASAIAGALGGEPA